jgi:hypothetical protein
MSIFSLEENAAKSLMMIMFIRKSFYLLLFFSSSHILRWSEVKYTLQVFGCFDSYRNKIVKNTTVRQGESKLLFMLVGSRHILVNTGRRS